MDFRVGDTSRGRGARKYQALRLRVLREQPLCATDCGRASVEVDHIVPLHRGGALMDRANLQGLCGGCHRVKTAREQSRIVPCDEEGWPIWHAGDVGAAGGTPRRPRRP